MANNATFNLNIKTTSDLNGINQIKQSLNELKNLSATSVNISTGKDLVQASAALKEFRDTSYEVEKALDNAFDVTTGVLNIQKLNKSLQTIGIDKIRKDFAGIGADGKRAFESLAISSLNTNLKLKETETILDRIGITLANTVRWQISSAAINKFTGAIQQAWGYSKHLDSSLNDIRIVTGKSADEMERFARKANDAAKQLGRATTDYTEASLIYYQQGLSDEEAQARAGVTLKAANVTGQSADEVSEQLTAVWNGYKVSANEAELYIDKLAAVAATTASDLEELSTGMSKVASAANAMGVDVDQLNAQLATIVSVTRQAPETAGTALKTIFARMSTIDAGGTDDEGATLTSYTEKMNNFGINVLDTNGHLREMGNVIEEIGEKWNSFSKEQQVALSQAMAGTRQYNNLMALFENFDMYKDALNTSKNALGTLQKQQDIYMESTEAHLEKLAAAQEGIFDSLVDNESINKLIDGFTSILSLVEQFVSALGGGKGLLLSMSSLVTSVFSKQLAQNLSPIIGKSKNSSFNKNQLEQDKIATTMWANENGISDDIVISNMIKRKQELQNYYDIMSEGEIQEANAQIEKIAKIEQEIEARKKDKESAMDFFRAIDNQNRGSNLTTDDVLRPGGLAQDADNQLNAYSEALKKLDKAIQKVQTDSHKSQEEQEKDFKAMQKAAEEAEKAYKNIDKTITNGLKLKESKTVTNLQSKNDRSGIGNQRNAINNMQAYIGSVKEEIAEASKTINVNKLVADGMLNSADAFAKSEMQMRQVIQGSSQLVSSFTSLAFSINTIKNLGSIWTDEDLSTGEKWLQTLMSSTSIVATLNNTIKGYTTGVNLLKEGLIGATAIQEAQNAAKAVGVELTKEEVLSQTSLFSILKQKLTVWALENGLLIEENGQLKLNITLETIKNALDLKKIAIYAALAVVIGGLVVGYKIYTDRLKDNAAAAKSASDEAKKRSDQAKEEAENISKLSNTYQDLADQYEKHEITLSDLRNSTYELCLQYNQTDLALKALNADYEQLNSLMNQNTVRANQAEKNALEKTKNAQAKTFEADFRSNLKGHLGRIDTYGEGLETIETLDLKGMYIRGQQSEKALAAGLESLLGTDAFLEDDQLNFDKFIDAALNSREELDKILSGNTSEAAEQIRKWLKDNEEILNSYYETSKEINEVTKQNILLSNQEGLEDSQDFFDSVVKMADEALENGIFKGKDAYDQAYQWAMSALAGAKDGYSQFSTDALLVSNFKNLYQNLSDKESYKAAYDEISKMSFGTKSLLSSLGSTIFNEKDLKNFANKFTKETQELFESNGISTKINIALQDALTGEPLTNNYINNLFADATPEIKAKLNLEGLNGQSAEQQAYNLVLADLQQQELYAQNSAARQAALQNIGEQKTQYQLENANISKAYGFSQRDSRLLAEQLSGQGGIFEGFNQQKVEELADAYSKVDGVITDLSEDQKELYLKLSEEQKNEIITIAKQREAYQKFEEGLQNYNDTLESINKREVKHAEAADKMNQIFEASNKKIDALQNAYKTYTSVAEEYNQVGALSIDNLQSLVELGPEYIQYLTDENGNLNLNKQGIIDATVAQLELNKASFDYTQIERVKAMLEAEDNERQWALFASTYSHAKSIENVTDELIKETAQEIIDTAVTNEWVKSKEEATEVANNWAKSLKNANAQFDGTINLVKTNIDAAMGGSNISKTLKNLEDEFDRYWDITKALDEVARALNRVDEIQSHLHGKELIKSLENENELLQQQAQYYHQLAAAQNEEAAELRQKLSGFGATFDESGNLTNYAAITASAVAAYNAGGNEEDYEKFKAALERYDTLFYNEIKDTEDKLRELQYQILENNLEKWRTEVELKLDLKDAEREWNDFLQDINEDFRLIYKDLGSEMETILKNVDTYLGSEGTLATQMAAMAEIEAEIDKMMAGGSSDKFYSVSDAQEELKKYTEELEKSSKDLKKAYEDAWNALLEGLDQVADKFEDIQEKFDLINGELEYQGKLISLLYGDKAYELNDKLFKAQEKNSLSQIKSLEKQKEFWQDQLDKAEEGTEEWQKAYENLNECQDQLNESVTAYIELLQKDYLNTIDKVLDELEKSLNGGMSIADMQEEWERISDYSSKYLDDVEASYKIQKLANKLDNSMNDYSNNLAAQKKLQAFRDQEIASLQERKDLTQEELDISEAKYEVLLKQIALEDAQNNKTSMKLVRNGQGNWSYQYVADANDVEKKQQDLLDAEYKVYEVSRDAYKENLENMMELNETYVDKLREIAELELTNKEEAERKRNELDAWYFDEYERLANKNFVFQEETTNAAKNLTKTLVDEDIANYKRLGDSASLTMDNILKEWTSGAQKIADGWNADDGKSVKDQVTSAEKKMEKALDSYQKKVDKVADVVKEDFSEKGITGSIKKATEQTKDLEKQTEKLAKTSTKELDSYRKAVESCKTAWEECKSSLVDSLETAIEYLKKVGEVAKETAKAIASVGGGEYKGGPGSGDDDPSKNTVWQVTNNSGAYFGTYATEEEANKAAIMEHGFVIQKTEADHKVDSKVDENNVRYVNGKPHAVFWENRYFTWEDWLQYWKGQNKPRPFDTGGYTGDWNDSSNGKLAILHKKELVLNADDTQNILNAVTLLRNAMVGNLLSNLNTTTSGNFNNINNSNENQNNVFNITIDATNKDVEEIKEAILELPSTINQYVNSISYT